MKQEFLTKSIRTGYTSKNNLQAHKNFSYKRSEKLYFNRNKEVVRIFYPYNACFKLQLSLEESGTFMKE